MTIEHILKLIKEGEGFTVEFKECVNALNNTVFETVCSFSNRYGGYIFLGVADDGEIIGVNPNCISDMKKNFVNMLNNPQKINPSLYLSLEEIMVDGKLVLYVYIPFNSQVEFCGGYIFDRNEDADINITHSTELVSNLYKRKAHSFTEREIFPYATEKELRLDLMDRVRQMALTRNPKHPWKNMSGMDILKSAGLYEENWATGQKGFNLACILLLGRDDVIRSCAPGYVTDCLLRRENFERYDDRLQVDTNLIESFDFIMDFIAKHTLDKFFLVDNQNVSIRSWIAREIVSNILVHREYSSAFPAKVIIESERIYAENWNRALKAGRIELGNFTPQPKNPLLANFFVNIGYADKLGSGVLNLYKYTKIYSGGEPELIEGDIFKTIVPLVKSDGKIKVELKVESQPLNRLLIKQEVLDYLKNNPDATLQEVSKSTGRTNYAIKTAVKELQDAGALFRKGAKKKGRWVVTK